MSTAPDLSVVIPTRNEAANIPVLWRRLESSLPARDVEVCFIDDSDDETPALLADLHERHGDRVVVRLRIDDERAGGLSTAVVAGIHLARGRYVCVMDADLQHRPETIPDMRAAAAEGADVVVASRYVRGGSRRGLAGMARRLVSRLATLLVRTLFVEARRSTDPLSGFFLCRRSLIDGIEFRPVGFKILLELLVCVPGLRVRDVPLTFEARSAGRSKASARQGLLFLAHVRSLVMDVDGSARMWKFAAVGLSGLLVFLPLLAVFSALFRVVPVLAFVPAFIVSLAWNTTLNRRWTFADQRRDATPAARGYMQRAVAGGVAMFVTFSVLTVALRQPTLPAGLIAGLVAMGVNGLTNLHTVRRGTTGWARLAIDHGVQAHLGALRDQIGADRTYLLPSIAGRGGGAIPPAILDRVILTKRPTLWIESASLRPQRRSNIERQSVVLVPLSNDGTVIAVLVAERRAPHGFDETHLEVATRAAEGLATAVAPALANAANDA